jgi:hypothetical protein
MLLVSHEGTMWVERLDLVSDPVLLELRGGWNRERVWDVIRPDGHMIATVKTPRGFDARCATNESIIGIVRDEDDVESIVELSLLHRNAGS